MRAIGIMVALLAVATSVQGQASENIVGAWQWQSTTYNNGIVETPSTAGFSVQLQFSVDGTFLRYRDNALFQQSEWGSSYVWVSVNGGMVHVEFVSTAVGDWWEPMFVMPFVLLELRNSTGGIERYSFMGPVSNEMVTWGSVKTQFLR